MFKPPKNPQDLLQNIKMAAEQGIFLNEDFYDEINLKNVIGNYEYIWQENAKDHKYIKINSLDFKNKEIDGCISEGVISWRMGRENGRGDNQALFNSKIHESAPGCSEFSVELIKAMLGTPTRVSDTLRGNAPPPHGRDFVFGKKTNPLGFTDIEFVIQGLNSITTITFEIRGDGIARDFRLVIREGN